MGTQRYDHNHHEFADDTPDDLDRVMMRMTSPQAPRTLVAAILAQTTRQAQPAWQQARVVLWMAYVVLLLLVAGGAVLFGQALHGTGTLDYLAFAAADIDLLRSNPGLFRDAVLEHMPWGNMLVLLTALVAWAAVTVALLRRLGAPEHGQTVAGAAR